VQPSEPPSAATTPTPVVLADAAGLGLAPTSSPAMSSSGLLKLPSAAPYAAAVLTPISMTPAPPLALPPTARPPATPDNPLLVFAPTPQPRALHEPLPKGLMLPPPATPAAPPAFPQAALVAFERRHAQHCPGRKATSFLPLSLGTRRKQIHAQFVRMGAWREYLLLVNEQQQWHRQGNWPPWIGMSLQLVGELLERRDVMIGKGSVRNN
jgi:hypothetical protein